MDDEQPGPHGPTGPPALAALAGWAALAEAVAAVADAPTWQLADQDILGALHAQAQVQAQLDAARLGLIRQVHQRGLAQAAGAASTPAFLAHTLRLDPRAAATAVRAARALDPAGDVPPAPGQPVIGGARSSNDPPVLAATGRALAAGEVSLAHTAAITATISALPADPDPVQQEKNVRLAETWLLDKCADFDPSTIRKLGKEIAHHLDPDGVLDDEVAARARDELWLTELPDGRVTFRGQTDALTGAQLTTFIDAHSAPAPATRDADGNPIRDPRTAAARRAAAFADLVHLAANADPSVSGGLGVQLIITTTLDTLRAAPGAPCGRTETDVPISAGLIRRAACDARIIPIVLGANSEPLDIGRATRLIPPAIRRALIARDKHCAFPGCRRPPRWADAHHLVHWADGGPTTLENLVLLCSFHHDLLHHADWQVAIIDGRPVFTPPTRLWPTAIPRGPTGPDAA